ncbi:MAG: response regulator [Lachnospiraceae bacterium]|nr:response regulator [Lachnospiraceae bacterium]
MENNMNDGKVLVISAKDSFLALSIIKKLNEMNIRTTLAHANIKEIAECAKDAELLILFLSEELAEMPNVLIYLKDLVQDKELGLIFVGEPSQYEFAIRMIPEQIVTEWFKRPIDMERLMKRINKYIDENTGENRKKTVLLVDDDITYMRTVYEWLKDRYHVGMAANGVQAISYLSRNKVDLILLDYEMPIANGPQVLSMLKNDSETGQIPVMFLTGHGDRDCVLSVVGLSPVDYLLKSIGKEGLLEKLRDFFNSQEKSYLV